MEAAPQDSADAEPEKPQTIQQHGGGGDAIGNQQPHHAEAHKSLHDTLAKQPGPNLADRKGALHASLKDQTPAEEASLVTNETEPAAGIGAGAGAGSEAEQVAVHDAISRINDKRRSAVAHVKQNEEHLAAELEESAKKAAEELGSVASKEKEELALAAQKAEEELHKAEAAARDADAKLQALNEARLQVVTHTGEPTTGEPAPELGVAASKKPTRRAIKAAKAAEAAKAKQQAADEMQQMAARIAGEAVAAALGRGAVVPAVPAVPAAAQQAALDPAAKAAEEKTAKDGKYWAQVDELNAVREKARRDAQEHIEQERKAKDPQLQKAAAAELTKAASEESAKQTQNDYNLRRLAAIQGAARQ